MKYFIFKKLKYLLISRISKLSHFNPSVALKKHIHSFDKKVFSFLVPRAVLCSRCNQKSFPTHLYRRVSALIN